MPGKNIYKILLDESYYHVYNRGVNKELIFLDSDDYRVFLNLLKRHLSDKSTKDKFNRPYLRLHGKLEVLAYCLMPNHFHLLIYQLNSEALEQLMRRVITSYGMYFNKKYNRVGPVFQGRYRASLIAQDTYLEHISRYIHLNPRKWQTYEYSSLPYFSGDLHASWVKPERILEIFNNRSSEYLAFLNDYEGYKRTLEDIKLEMANNH